MNRQRLTSLLNAAVLGWASLAAAQASPDETSPALSRKYEIFLEEAALLIGEEEQEIFLTLSKDYQRDAFIERFWRVRDPFPETPRNEFHDRWAENVRAAKDKYEDLNGDRARMMLLNGPPHSSFQARCAEVLHSLEIWYYSGTPILRSDFFLIFIRQGPRYRLWYPSWGLSPLLSFGFGRTDQEVAEAITSQCSRGDEILGAVSRSADWHQIEERVELTPQPGVEWAETFLSYSTDLPEGAEPLAATWRVDFPGRYSARTVVQTLVSVDRDAAATTQVGPRTSYNFLIDGEVIRRGELFEHFRYRFDFPLATAAPGGAALADATDHIPLILQRYLRPGSYTLVLRVQDLNSEKYFRESRPVQVPNLRLAPRPVSAGETTTVSDQVSVPRLVEANATISDGATGEGSLKLRAPTGKLMTGKVRVEALTTGDGISKVRFALNGKPVFSKTRPPFSVELDLGRAPRIHTLAAMALSMTGDVVARDEIVLNTGPHRFDVRLIEPQRGHTYRNSVRAHAEVAVPESELLDRVEFYLNDTLVATLFQRPFVQPILIPPNQDLSYVRAVGYLDDGSAAEDLVFVNAPDLLEEVQVNFVELYTSVLDAKGRPAEGLTREEFTVYEDGTKQEIRRFELVRDLPIHAGILLDTSTSMTEELDEAEEAAMHFFQIVLTPKDRACLITFNDEPQLGVRFTNSVEVLAGGLAGLVAEGETALYDSLIYTLYYFSGIRGKRALILLSDGQDVRSRYEFEEVIEFARRTGVAIYSVGLDIPSKETDARNKLMRLSQETGGRHFFVEGASELKTVYSRIQRELRSQYLIAYQSSEQDLEDRFREVKLDVARPGLKAKTLRGYYP